MESAEQIWLQAQILNSINEAVVATDLDGRITYWGPCAEKLYGIKAAEAIGRLYNECAGSVEREHTEELKQHVLEHGSWSGEHEQERADGSRFWSSTHVSLMRNEQGMPCGFIGIDYDITERKQAEEKLAIYAAELEQNNLMMESATQHANELAVRAEASSIAKSEFLANMSHEIRTPMNGVIGMANLLLDTELDDTQRRFAEVVLSSAESLLTLINDILDFSKIEAKKLDLEIVDFDLHRMVDDIHSNFSMRALEKEIECIHTISPNVPHLLKGDPVRLRQILVNLIGNAIKFTEKGRVETRVETASSSESDDTDPIPQPGGTISLRFSVRDTGIGIPAEKLDRLFQQFSQVDGSTTRKYGGTGLGLAISKQLVELMGGAIGVQSEVGKGTEFWFVVPLECQSTAQAVAPPPAPTRSTSSSTDLSTMFAGRKANILLAEDNATNQQVALMLLKKMGLEADAVTDGEKALEALQHEPYNLILMDVQMPNMDGLAATQAIRQTNNPIPIIAMTAHAMQGDRDRCLEAGMNDYVTKPISVRDLADVLDRWLPAASASEVPAEEQPAAEAAETPPSASPVVWDKASMMARFMNDDELGKFIVRSFLDDLPQLLAQLQSALAAGEGADAERHAHSIKGAASNVGGTAVSRLAQRIEEKARAGQLDNAKQLAAEMDEALHQLRTATRTFLD